MPDSPLLCVIDASVFAKYFLPEPNAEQASRLLNRILDVETEFHVPSLFYAEMANIFWNSAQRGHATPEQARENMADLVGLDLISHPMEALSVVALDISLSHSVSSYDASHVALSELVHLPLVTADGKLQRKLDSNFGIRLLSEFTS